MDDLPIACSLSAADLRERKAGTLADLLAAMVEVRTLDGGYAFRLSDEAAVLAQVLQAIRQERTCCPFLRFDLAFLPDQGPTWLHITGPDGTRPFLADLLGLPATGAT